MAKAKKKASKKNPNDLVTSSENGPSPFHEHEIVKSRFNLEKEVMDRAREDIAMSILGAVVSARPSASPVDINQDLVVNCFKAADIFLDVASNYKSKQNEDQED